MSKTAIIHISDLHFKENHAQISKILAEKITASVLSVMKSRLPIIIVVSGDLAFSGKTEQYEVFDRFLSNIEEGLAKSGKADGIHFIAVPGNHDCDFGDEHEVRALIINSPESLKSEKIKTKIAAVQKNFWIYLSKKLRDPELVNPVEYYEKSINGITFRCINSAWTSQIKEERGRLRVLTNDTSSDYKGVVISIFHHPYSWINMSDSNALKNEVESTSMLTFSGHEHSLDVYTKIRSSGGTAYVEAGALLENSVFSRFNYIEIDEDKAKIYSFRVKYKADFVDIESASEIFTGSLRNTSSKLAVLDRSFRVSLSKMSGISLIKSEDALEKLFIYPNIEEIDISRKKKDFKTIISQDVVKELMKLEKVIIHGEANCGKTSFAKKLFVDLYEDGFYPLIINYQENGDISIEEFINTAVEEQYKDLTPFKYFQIESEKRVILVDSISTSYRSEIRRDLLEYIELNFGKVFLFTNIDPIESLLRRLKESMSDGYKRFRILGLNSYLRRQLIESVMENSSLSGVLIRDRSYYQRVSEIEVAIDTSLRSRLISAYPIYIIGILQYYIKSSGKTVAGSNNFVYDLLVKNTIADISQNDSEFHVYETFLSRLAFKMLSERIFSIGQDDMFDFTEAHISKFGLQRVTNYKSLTEMLISTRILELDDVYSFKHRHLIYYFAALYMRNFRSDERQNKFFESMLDNLDSTAHLNTIAFMVYLTKDYSIVEDIMAKAEKIIVGLPEKMITDLKHELSNKQQLMNNTLIESFEKLKAQDGEPDYEIEIAEGDKIELRKVISSLRILDLLGEVVKNHVGSWEDTKNYIIVELCYRMAQKISGHLYFRMDEIIKDIVEGETKRISFNESSSDFSKMSGIRRSELNSVINRNVYGFMEMVSANLINRVALAVGTPKMRDIYSKIVSDTSNPDYLLIDATVDMNTSMTFPEQKIIKLSKAFEDNKFVSRTLRNLVYYHFSRYPNKRIVVNRVMGELDIRLSEKGVAKPIFKAGRNNYQGRSRF